MAAPRSARLVLVRRGHVLLAACVLILTTIAGAAANNASRPVLLMLTQTEEPFASHTERDGKTAINGFVKDLMQELSDILKVDVQIQLMPGDAPESEMLSRLPKSTADVVGPMTITGDRVKLADFTKPILANGIIPVIKKASSGDDDRFDFPWLPLPSEIFVILKPFCAGVWLISLLCFIGVSIFLYLINRFNPRERRYENEIVGGYDDDFGLAGSFLYTFSCMVWQGYTRAPRSISGRILTAFWWIFVVIFLMSYTAKLVFYLNHFPAPVGQATASGQPLSIESIHDALRDGTYTFGVVKNSYEYDFFRKSNVDTYKKVWSKMSAAPDESFVKNKQEGFAKARKGNFIFLTNLLAADFALSRKPCDLRKVGRALDSTGIGLAVKKGSEYRDKLSLGILKLREDGQLAKLSERWWLLTGECPSQSAPKRGPRLPVYPLELEDFGGAFILLLIGAVLAAIALLLEIVFTRRQKNKKQTVAKKPEETAMVDSPAETAKV